MMKRMKRKMEMMMRGLRMVLEKVRKK